VTLKKKSFTKLAMMGAFAFLALGLVACNQAEESAGENNSQQTQNAPNETDNRQPVGGSHYNTADDEGDVPEWMLEMIPESSREAFAEAFRGAMDGDGGATIFSPETGEIVTGDEALEIGREQGLIPEDED